jgi:hypothetical protein
MVHSLVQKYRRKGILVDANLLIGLLVGSFGPEHLHNCRATKKFSPEHYSVLLRLVGQFDLIITTPHILTEVSNLAGSLPDNLIQDFRKFFAQAIAGFSEQTLPAKEIARNQEFPRFGLTDTGIAMVAPGSYLVLTVDLDLYLLLSARRVHVINFNHVLASDWGSQAGRL